VRGRLVLVAVLLAPAAQAAIIDANLVVGGNAVFQGQTAATAQWVGSLQDARLGETVQAELFAVGSPVVHQYRYVAIDEAPGSPTGAQHRLFFLDSNDSSLPETKGPIAVLAQTPLASIRLIPFSAQAMDLDGNFTLEPAQQLRSRLAFAGDPQPPEVAPAFYPPTAAILHASLPPFGFDGRLIASGVLLQMPSGILDLRPTETAAGAVGGRYAILTTRVLEISGNIQAPEQGSWTAQVAGIEGRINGDLTFYDAQGSGSLNATPLPDGIHMFQAIGSMSVRSIAEPTKTRWRVEGEPGFVAVNGKTLVGGRNWIAASVGIGVVTIVLVAAQRILSGIVAGYNRANPLANSKRTAILELIASSPGINQLQLASEVRTSRANVRHHVRILLKSGLVEERHFEGRRTYTLNDGSFDFAVATANGSLPAAKVIATMRNPIRQAILESLRNGPMTARELRKPIGSGRGDSIAYHLGILKDEGLIARHTESEDRRWHLAFDPNALTAHHRRAFIAKAGLADTYGALVAGHRSTQNIQRHLERLGIDLPKNRIEKEVRLLQASGYITEP
jgi:predicted transcriptional regulator